MNQAAQTYAQATEQVEDLAQALMGSGRIKNVALVIFVLVMIATGAGVYMIGAQYLPLVITTLGQAAGIAALVAAGLTVVALVGFVAHKFSKPMAVKVINAYDWATTKVKAFFAKKNKAEPSLDAGVAAA